MHQKIEKKASVRKMSKMARTITGSVRPRPNSKEVKYYDIVLELGKDAFTGKRKRLYYKAETTDRKEAENMLLIKKAEYLQGEAIEPTKKTVAQFLDEYMEDYVRVNASPATINDYGKVIEKYLKPEFGHVKLQELTRSHVQKVYNGWKTKSTLSDNPLRATTILHINRVFKAAMNVAIDLNYIKDNPTNKVRVGKDDVTQRLEVFTTEEIKELQKAVKGSDMELPVALLLDCIMRRGELLGLRYSDIDFKNNIVTIQYAWTESEEGKCPKLKDCKTESSYRKIVVSDYTMKLLKRQKLIYMQNRMMYGENFCNSDRVICKENGEPFLPKSFTHKWSATLKKHGIRHIKLHGMRHSAISLLVSEGVPVQMVQQRAGHKDPKITLSVYSHVAKDKQHVVAEKLDSLIFSAVNE